MKLRYVLTVSLFTVFMIPFIKNMNTADALDKYGCDNPDRKMHINWYGGQCYGEGRDTICYQRARVHDSSIYLEFIMNWPTFIWPVSKPASQ